MASSVRASSPLYLFSNPIEDQRSSTLSSIEETPMECLEKMPSIQNSDIFTFFDLAYNHFDLLAICPLEDTRIQYPKPSPILSDEELPRVFLTDSSDGFSPHNLDDEHRVYALHSPRDSTENAFTCLTLHSPGLNKQEEDCERSPATPLSTIKTFQASGSNGKNRGIKRKERSVVSLSVSKEIFHKNLTTLRGRYIFQYIEEIYTKNRIDGLFEKHIKFNDFWQDYKNWSDEKRIGYSGRQVIQQMLPYANIHYLENDGVLEINRGEYLEGIKRIKQDLEKHDRIFSHSSVAKYIGKSLRSPATADWNFGGTNLANDLYRQFIKWSLRRKRAKRSFEDFSHQFPRWLPCISVSDDQTVFSIPCLKICKSVFKKIKKDGWDTSL